MFAVGGGSRLCKGVQQAVLELTEESFESKNYWVVPKAGKLETESTQRNGSYSTIY